MHGACVMDYNGIDGASPVFVNVRSLTKVAAWVVLVAFFLLVTVSSALNIYTSTAVMSLLSTVNQFVDKANALFEIIYTYGCISTHFISPASCSILQVYR